MPWSVVVPVKRLAVAKSRLALPAALRRDLALAMALDTVAAAAAAKPVGEVVVVTDEDPAPFDRLGATVVADAPAAGLNPALRHAAARSAGPGVAALAADLPALLADDLDSALESVPPGRCLVVPDAAGAGTTLLAAHRVPLQPVFGPGSFAAHVALGAVPLVAAAPSLRRDVDSVADLVAAVDLGAGPHTLTTLALASDLVQATVRRFDPASRSGDVLLDDGTLLPYGADAFDRSGLRLLRLGQRVRILVDEGRVVFLTLATFADPAQQ